MASTNDGARPLSLSALESFYVGGEVEPCTGTLGDDQRVVGAMYVLHIAPAQPTFPLPVIFVHGGMHTGVTWETTPDGREGWQLLFVRGGFDTFVIDQPWRGRSAPDLAGLDPTSTAVVDPAITVGIGLAEIFARGGEQFPMGHVATYAAQLWPDFGIPGALAVGVPARSDPRSLPPLLELIDRLGRVVLVTHSQGGDLGWQVARRRPAQVAAIVAVEPGVTSPGLDDADFPDIPVCVMWGDNLPAEGLLSQQDVAVAREIAAGRPGVHVDLLADDGIVGNGHMLMMEANNALLAARVMSWLRSMGVS